VVIRVSGRFFGGLGQMIEGHQIQQRLESAGHQLVLAESCTAGLIAATLARTPGMSRCLCGSLVVYQIASKQVWLGLADGVVNESNVVSREVALLMAEGALRQTPQATVSLAITGHLGPGAPTGLDGVAWLGVSFRGGASFAECLQLPETYPAGFESLRAWRQESAVNSALACLLRHLG
jgi:PncC family amidohydrolase